MPESKKIVCGGPRARFCRRRVAGDAGCVAGTFRVTPVQGSKRGVKKLTCRVRAHGPRGGRTKVLSFLYPKKDHRCNKCSR